MPRKSQDEYKEKIIPLMISYEPHNGFPISRTSRQLETKVLFFGFVSLYFYRRRYLDLPISRTNFHFPSRLKKSGYHFIWPTPNIAIETSNLIKGYWRQWKRNLWYAIGQYLSLRRFFETSVYENLYVQCTRPTTPYHSVGYPYSSNLQGKQNLAREMGSSRYRG